MADPDHNAHDKLFKAGFSDPATASAFLRAELPEEVASLVDWASLRLEPGSFVDSEFRHCESDLLFSARVAGREARIHLLFEHQSRRDPLMALRLLRYMVRIWESWVGPAGKGMPLPAIIPVVLGQDATVWKVEPRFSALFDLSGELAALGRYVPDFDFRLIQLAAMPFEAIAGTSDGVLILRVLKAERTGELLGPAVWDEALLLQVGRSIFERVLRYILGQEDVDRETFERTVSQIVSPQIHRDAMTLAQQYRQEGRREGREEGSLASLRMAVLEALSLRFGEVPEGLREAVETTNDAGRLREWHRAAIVSPSLEVFSEQL